MDIKCGAVIKRSVSLNVFITDTPLITRYFIRSSLTDEPISRMIMVPVALMEGYSLHVARSSCIIQRGIMLVGGTAG